MEVSDIKEISNLKDLLRGQGHSKYLIASLDDPERIALLCRFLATRKVKVLAETIDFDNAPFCPPGLKILPAEMQLENRLKGKWLWNPFRTGLQYSEKQYEKRVIGNELLFDLVRIYSPVLPANILDFYEKEENREIVPTEWKGKKIFAWGTIYADASGERCIRYFLDGATGYEYLREGFNRNSPTLIDIESFALYYAESSSQEKSM